MLSNNSSVVPVMIALLNNNQRGSRGPPIPAASGGELLITSDSRATYEATESDIRLISYRTGPDNAIGIFAGLLLTILLAGIGKTLKQRLAVSAPLPERVSVRIVRWRKMAGARPVRTSLLTDELRVA